MWVHVVTRILIRGRGNWNREPEGWQHKTLPALKIEERNFSSLEKLEREERDCPPRSFRRTQSEHFDFSPETSHPLQTSHLPTRFVTTGYSSSRKLMQF